MTRPQAWSLRAGLFALSTALAACHAGEAAQEQTFGPPPARLVAVVDGADAPGALQLRVPIRGVMAGIVDFSAHGVFKTATAEGELGEDDWIAAGYAAINLISASTLITSPGTGVHDAEWVADPLWRRISVDLQASSIDAGIAISRRNRKALLAAADEIAVACESCHARFRVEPTPQTGTRLADLGPHQSGGERRAPAIIRQSGD